MTYHQKHFIAICMTMLFWLVSVPAVWGADIPIVSGTVIDGDGEPVIGATVRELNTSNATITDIDGNFTMKLTSKKPVLEISYIGYKTVKVPVTGPTVNVTMEIESTDLDEVVVVAYGQQKKVTVTGSVAAVGSAEIKKSSEPNLAAALSGKLPGLTTMQTSGAPGEDDVKMFLRGAATTNGTSPLILVDGIPRTSMSEIDPNEVQSISVLKDASSTAVFGVRGANGVILITTRRGEEGKVNVHGQVNYSMQKFNFWPEGRHSYDFVRMANEASLNDGGVPKYTDAQVALYDLWKTGGSDDPAIRYWYPDTDWGDVYLKDHSNMVQANVNISGGSKKLKYFVSAGYVYQGGMYKTEPKSVLGYDPQSKMNRYNIRTNLDYNFNNWISASLDVSSYIRKTNQAAANMAGANTAGLRWAALTSKPTVPGPLTIAGNETNGFVVSEGMRDNGELGVHYVKGGRVVQDSELSLAQSAYGQLNRSGYKLLVEASANAIATLNFNLDRVTKGLSARGVVSFETYSQELTMGSKNFSGYLYDLNPGAYDRPVFLMEGDSEDDGQLALSRADVSRWFMNLQAQVNYNRTFNDVHGVTGMVLFQRDEKENILGSIPYKMIGLAGRFTYAFDSRYLAEVNMGYNGSEQFAPGHRFGFFPAFSLGWVASNEKFMQPLAESGWLTKLKFRASVGKVGNDELYAGADELTRQKHRFLYLDNNSKVPYLSSPQETIMIPGSLTSAGDGTGLIYEGLIGNPDIHWETAWKQNYAVDLTLFRNLDLTFDWFYENRSDILISRNTIPSLSGLSPTQLPRSNFGKVKNTGYEISARYNYSVNRNLDFFVTGNFSYAKNTVINADEVYLGDDYAYPYRTEGFRIGQQFGYLIDRTVNPELGLDGTGFYNSNEQIEKRGLTYTGIQPKKGDFVYKDLNKDGIIDSKDMAPIGYSSLLPRISYGLTLGGNAYGFDFSVMLQGVGKYTRYFGSQVMYEGFGTIFFSDMCDNRWSDERYAAGATITHPRLSLADTSSHIANDYYTMDASYVRLKNITVGYTIPKNITKKIGMNSVRVYLSADNIHTWNNLRTKMIDPEQSDFSAYPLMKTYTAGLSIDL